MDQLTVLDIFCGAGGFSEGFRQQGFEIIRGVDKWQPAIDTFKFNFGTESCAQDVLDFVKSVESIYSLPDTDVILGSPPCVSFSSSNNSGKADKESGIELTKAFLRIVAVKKFKADSILKAWFMENVPRSTKHLLLAYSFRDLDLVDWALGRSIDPDKIAITLDGQREDINSANYGSPQTRVRTITGDIFGFGFEVPEPTHSKQPLLALPRWRSIKDTIRTLPDPSAVPEPNTLLTDPNYPEITIEVTKVSDHFYDTGLYKCEWEQSHDLKTNHPYMGRMSFPENDERPSRTVTATKIGSSREALIYKSGFDRPGDGEYRTPTVREAACLMSFPLTYQFLGSEGTKWRLVGNAVCPSVSRSLARSVLQKLGHAVPECLIVSNTVEWKRENHITLPREKLFFSPPNRNKNSRFRRHAFKDGSMTVTLSNYDIDNKGKDITRWIASVQYGQGDGRKGFIVPEGIQAEIEAAVRSYTCGAEFIETVEREIVARTAEAKELQILYEVRAANNGYLQPASLVSELKSLIDSMNFDRNSFEETNSTIFPEKESVPTKQLFALYGINRIAMHVNGSD